MIRGELATALYWVFVAVVLGLYLWVLKTADLGFYILLIILVLMGIGYSIVYGGETHSSFIDYTRSREIDKKIEELDKKIDGLLKTVEEIKKLLEE